MKKVTAVFLSVLLILSLTACGQQETSRQENMQSEGNTNRTQDTDMQNGSTQVQETDIEDGFIRITGGSFLMGSPEDEAWRSDDEIQHSVTVSDFYMSPYEVTQKEYEDAMGNNPSSFSGDDLPVESVSWLDAVSYCNVRSQQEGLTSVYVIDGQNVSWDRSADGYRLPTEAEWEYACRAGTTTPFYMENSPSAEEANYYGHYPYGIKDDWLAAFMMSSILLNPQLIIYSAALGQTALVVRIISCFLCGIIAGLLIRLFYRKKTFFDFNGFEEPKSRDTDPNIFLRFVKNLGRNVKATGLYFLFGIVLSAVFQRYVPQDMMTDLFGENEAWGVLMAATIGIPLYACGGGTIPLLQAWLYDGMSMGSAAAFMITGPATKITNLGAVKIVLGIKRFILYITFIMFFSLVTGLVVNLII